MLICRICLTIDTKLFSMDKYNLFKIYEDVSGIIVNDNLPKTLCWECTHRITNSYHFKQKALKTYNLLLHHYNSYSSLKSTFNIDRHTNNLTSQLKCTYFENNHCNLYLNNSDINKEETSEIYHEKYELSNSDLILDQNYVEIGEYNVNEESNLSTDSSIVLSKHKNKKTKRKEIKKHKQKEILNEEIFTITDLTYEEEVDEIKRREESSNYKNAEFKCVDCFKGFVDESAFNSHLIRHTDEAGEYSCEICKIRFKKSRALRNHITSHSQKFRCKRCTYVTTRRHAAKLHEEYHNGTRYKCPHCPNDFSKFSTYMSHVRLKHPSDYVCLLCGYSFVSEKGLQMHKKFKHRFDENTIPNDGPYCKNCDLRFLSTEALNRHIKLSTKHKHEQVTKNVNKDRIQKTENKEDIQKKTSKKKVEGPIPCEQCNMQLPNSVLYYRHFRRMHPDKNRTNYPSMKTRCMCEVCGKMFQSLALLQDHSFTHTDDKQFKCTQCDKSFQRKYRLIAHKRVHTSQRRSHACTVCGKRFTTSGNMQRHMVSHTGLKPFKCEMCNKSFKHASEKRVHITYVHLKKPWPKRSRGKRLENKQNQTQQPSMPSDVDLIQPLWPAYNDPKINDMTDKTVYYNIKI